MAKRHLILPATGPLLVSTDLHGNLADFRALERRFQAMGPGAHWVLLGDFVHGPNDAARAAQPELYGYPDESAELVAATIEARDAAPGRVHVVLGNHDHGHVGGPHTHKFHRDEVAFLEQGMTPAALDAMRSLFAGALLAVAAPCGLFLSHGSPDDSLQSLADLDRIDDLANVTDPAAGEALPAFLTHYGQQDATSARFLASMSRSTGLDLRVVVHGHDKDERGFFYEGERQLCLSIFGAPRSEKRCLVVDLAARYGHVGDLRDGFEIRRVHDA